MTRPETLIRQIAEARLAPLRAERQAIALRAFPPPAVTPKVREIWHRWRAATRAAERLKKQYMRAGGLYSYTNKPTMQGEGKAREAAAAVVANEIARIEGRRQSALLAVLGLSAEEARRIVLRFNRDVGKGRKL